MKAAISLDDALVKKADAAARELGVSRSRLFSIAVERFLRELRNEEMLDRLNRVYAGETDPEERQIAAGFKAKFRAGAKDRW